MSAPTPEPPQKPAAGVPSRLRKMAPLLAFVLAFCWLGHGLVRSGALDSDLSGDPDEAAHAVTALMVRDYLFNAEEKHPLHFAQSYYEAFPKVALGHYPPAYYLTTALFLKPCPRVTALLWLQVAALSVLAALVVMLGSSPNLSRAGWPAALPLMHLPPLAKSTVLVMADLQLAVWCLLAAMAWMRFLQSGRARWSLAFGVTAAAAILTKGSGMMLAAVPVVSTLLAGKVSMMRKPAWWLAALPVLVLVAPWMLKTASITQEGMLDETLGMFFFKSLAFYSDSLPRSAGWLAIMMLFGISLPAAAWHLIKRGPLDPQNATLWALLLGGALLVVLVPAGLTTRYLIPLLGPAALLALSAVTRLTVSTMPQFRVWLPWLLSVGVLCETAYFPEKHLSGYALSAEHLLESRRQNQGAEQRWLVASDARGEGAVIAAVCYGLSAEERLSWKVRTLRGSKVLATSDWLGRDYQPSAGSTAEMTRLLDQLKVNKVLLDGALPASSRAAHLDMLAKTLLEMPDQWRLEKSLPIQRASSAEKGSVQIYSRIPRP